ncbi:MAG: hypothetical protein NVS9B15_20690 [Acidobacteriaceae bacterium]
MQKSEPRYPTGMTDLLQEAFRVAQQLPDSDQDVIAARILDEIRDEQLWNQKFSASVASLQSLADQAWTQHETGETIPLDDDQR